MVALWFWAPLLLGGREEKISAGSEAKTTAVRATSNAHNGLEAAQTGDLAPGTRPASHRWDQVADWMDADPRTSAAELPRGRAEPFHPPAPDPNQREMAEKSQELKPTEETPEAVGLELSSTVIGPERRVALISGKAYQEGQSVTVTKGDQPITFRLVEIHSRRVVLEQRGKRFDMSIPDQQPSGSVQVSSSKP